VLDRRKRSIVGWITNRNDVPMGEEEFAQDGVVWLAYLSVLSY
jgi:hypothetical protein